MLSKMSQLLLKKTIICYSMLTQFVQLKYFAMTKCWMKVIPGIVEISGKKVTKISAPL